MSEKTQLQQISNRITIGRNLALVFHVFAIILVVTLLFLPGALSLRVKVWSVSAAGVSFIAILIGLVLVRHDSSSVLYFSYLSFLTTGVFLGYSIFELDKLL